METRNCTDQVLDIRFTSISPKMEVPNIITAMHGDRKVNFLVDLLFGDTRSFIPKFDFFCFVLMQKVWETAHLAARLLPMDGVERLVYDNIPSSIVILPEMNLRDLWIQPFKPQKKEGSLTRGRSRKQPITKKQTGIATDKDKQPPLFTSPPFFSAPLRPILLQPFISPQICLMLDIPICICTVDILV